MSLLAWQTGRGSLLRSVSLITLTTTAGAPLVRLRGFHHLSHFRHNPLQQQGQHHQFSDRGFHRHPRRRSRTSLHTHTDSRTGVSSGRRWSSTPADEHWRVPKFGEPGPSAVISGKLYKKAAQVRSPYMFEGPTGVEYGPPNLPPFEEFTGPWQDPERNRNKYYDYVPPPPPPVYGPDPMDEPKEARRYAVIQTEYVRGLGKSPQPFVPIGPQKVMNREARARKQLEEVQLVKKYHAARIKAQLEKKSPSGLKRVPDVFNVPSHLSLLKLRSQFAPLMAERREEERAQREDPFWKQGLRELPHLRRQDGPFKFNLAEFEPSEWRRLPYELMWFPDNPVPNLKWVEKHWKRLQLIAYQHRQNELLDMEMAILDEVRRESWLRYDVYYKSLLRALLTNKYLLHFYIPLKNMLLREPRDLWRSQHYRVHELRMAYNRRYVDPDVSEAELRARVILNLEDTYDAIEGLRREQELSSFWRPKFVFLPTGFIIAALLMFFGAGLLPFLPAWVGRQASRFTGKIADAELGSLLVRLWGIAVGVDFEEAELPVGEYTSIQKLFTRNLKPGLRPVDPFATLVSPADSRVVSYGDVTPNLEMIVKGRRISVDLFLAQEGLSRRPGLKYCVLYLAPRDYHGYHAPANMLVDSRLHFPGLMLSVAPWFIGLTDKVWTDNERVVLRGRWAHGEMWYGAVGAFNVGSMTLETEPDLVTNIKHQEVSYLEYPTPFEMDAGARVGGFKMGSSIVLIFDAPRSFEFTVKPGDKVTYGQSLGEIAQDQEMKLDLEELRRFFQGEDDEDPDAEFA